MLTITVRGRAVPRFDERWISAEQLTRTAELAGSTNHLVGDVIEIGVWQGLSAIPIAHAVAPSVLNAVDHWLGDNAGVQGIDPELVRRDNYGIFMGNVAEAGLTGQVVVWRMDWREFARRWRWPVRFVHIDATHTADEVADTIELLRPHMVAGGIFAGDDYDWPLVAEGVHRHFSVVQEGPGRLWWVRL
jgi:hypothetical protein